MKAQDGLVAIVLAYGGKRQCAPLLRQLRCVHEANDTGMTIVVHNPSYPGEQSGLAGDDFTRIVENSENIGYAGGMNEGIRVSADYAPSWVLLLTHEVRLEPDTVVELLTVLGRASAFAAVGPVLYDAHGSLFHSGLERPGRARWRLRASPPACAPATPWACDSLDGSVMLWRGEVLHALHGFQARFFMYFEEIELCCRARRAGWRVGVVPTASAQTTPGGAGRPLAHGYLRARNRLQCAREESPLTLLVTACDLLFELWSYTPKPGGKRSKSPTARAASRAHRRGVVFGAADFARGRWGPPPPEILSGSDIGAVETGGGHEATKQLSR